MGQGHRGTRIAKYQLMASGRKRPMLSAKASTPIGIAMVNTMKHICSIVKMTVQTIRPIGMRETHFARRVLGWSAYAQAGIMTKKKNVQICKARTIHDSNAFSQRIRITERRIPKVQSTGELTFIEWIMSRYRPWTIFLHHWITAPVLHPFWKLSDRSSPHPDLIEVTA